MKERLYRNLADKQSMHGGGITLTAFDIWTSGRITRVTIITSFLRESKNKQKAVRPLID